MRIADRELPRDEALAMLRCYARRHAGTVLLYDLAGDGDGFPGPKGAAEPVDAVTLADVGRLVVINAGLRAGDVPLLVDVAARGEFAAAPAARLEECTPGSALCRAGTFLYDLFRLPGVGGVKRSKLLHIKRPFALQAQADGTSPEDALDPVDLAACGLAGDGRDGFICLVSASGGMNSTKTTQPM